MRGGFQYDGRPIPAWRLFRYTQEDLDRAQFAGAFLAARKRRELEADLERVLHYEMFGRVLPRAPDPDDTQLQERGQVRDDVPANQRDVE